MAAIQIKPAPDLLRSIVQNYFMNKSIYLGIITVGNELNQDSVETVPTSFVTKEYASGAWLRPAFSIFSAGTFNSGLDQWELPSSLQWSVTGPPGGISIKQIVVTIGGTSTPRNTDGVVVGVGTYTTPIVIAAGITQTIEAPWSIS